MFKGAGSKIIVDEEKRSSDDGWGKFLFDIICMEHGVPRRKKFKFRR